MNDMDIDALNPAEELLKKRPNAVGEVHEKTFTEVADQVTDEFLLSQMIEFSAKFRGIRVTRDQS
jgi:hypothetical protein